MRWVWTALGWVFMALAVAGIPLPVLPTTPFVLLAAACFAKGSPKLDRWLLEHPRFGPGLRIWREHGGISSKARRAALALMWFFIGISTWHAPVLAVKIALPLVALGVSVFLLRLPTIEPEDL